MGKKTMGDLYLVCLNHAQTKRAAAIKYRLGSRFRIMKGQPEFFSMYSKRHN